tara:strand:- start:1235 stop:1432 length:198 start_codon:yes stop_codon:yes gene_type:complete
MSLIKIPEQDTWWIGRKEDMPSDQIVYAFNGAGVQLGCGQPIYEEFFNEADWLERLAELGVTPEE